MSHFALIFFDSDSNFFLIQTLNQTLKYSGSDSDSDSESKCESH